MYPHGYNTQKCVPFESSQKWIKMRIVLMFYGLIQHLKNAQSAMSIKCVRFLHSHIAQHLHSLQCLKCWYVPILPKNAYCLNIHTSL